MQLSWSHFLGLDVHDANNHYEPVPVGAVMTCGARHLAFVNEGIGIPY